MTAKEQIDSVLNDIEKMELARFAENKTQYEAVKKVLLFGLYYSGVLEAGKPASPLHNFALNLVSAQGVKSDKEIGEELRGKWQGINFVEGGFQTISEYKIVKEEPKKLKNPAR